MYFFKHKNVIDVNIVKSYHFHEEVIKEGSNKLKSWYEGTNKQLLDINLAVPLVKHYEVHNDNFKKFKKAS